MRQAECAELDFCVNVLSLVPRISLMTFMAVA